MLWDAYRDQLASNTGGYLREVCQHCGVETRPEASFCHGCGRAVAYQCLSCQSVYTPGSRFCATCGTSLQEPASDSLPPDYAHTASGLLACPRCQSSNQPDATYCYSCGFPQEGAIHIAEARFPGVPAYTQARPGGFWIRLMAILIDFILLALVFKIISQFISIGFASNFWNVFELGSNNLYSLLLALLYFTLSLGVWATTAAKRLFGLHVVRTDGSKVGLGRALARFFASYLSLQILGIGFLMVAFRRDKRGLHDLICDTVVIQR